MASPLSPLSQHTINSLPTTEEDEITWHDPPSSPFISHVDGDQENIPPMDIAATPSKNSLLDDDVPQSAFKVSSPSKKLALQDKTSPVISSPTKPLLDEQADATLGRSTQERNSPKKASPIKQAPLDRPTSSMSNSSRGRTSPLKSSPVKRPSSNEADLHAMEPSRSTTPDAMLSPAKRPVLEPSAPALRENEGLTIAMKILEETRIESHEYRSEVHSGSSQAGTSDDIEFNPDMTSPDIDDTCFSAFSEVPNVDMTKFSFTKGSPTRPSIFDQATPRGRVQMTPSTVRRNQSRTPSPTPRRAPHAPNGDNDTTNLLLDFTQQIEAFTSGSRRSPTRGRQSPTKSSTESNLLSFIQRQRSPAKGSNYIHATPAEKRQTLNLLDFELPPPPTPRSVPTVTIRELESLKSSFQSQISSLTASLSGKEAEVDSLVKAVNNAERRVGEAQEHLRDERSAREHAESQMEDWKKKGEEVQELLKNVQDDLNRQDEEREVLMRKLEEASRRAEEAEAKALDAEQRAVEAESRCVDTTTMLDAGPSSSAKRYTEEQVQQMVNDNVNTTCKELHSIYKAKHERKIKTLRESYAKKTESKTEQLTAQIQDLEKKIEEFQSAKDNTFSKVLPADLTPVPNSSTATSAADIQRLSEQQKEIEALKAKLAGLEQQLRSVQRDHHAVLKDLETERVEKGELVAAAEQMLQLQMEMQAQQEELRKSVAGGPPPPSLTNLPTSATGSALTSGIARPASGLRGPGGFGYHGGPAALSRSTSGSGKSRIMSSIERMGGARSAPPGAD